jgi:hypothetical protein
MNKERLELVAKKLESLPPERFNYSSWIGKNWEGAQDLSCGTTACALGWAATIPELQEAGLRIVAARDEVYDLSYPYVALSTRRQVVPMYEANHESVVAAMWVFELTEDEVSFLFMPESPQAHEEHEEAEEHCTALVDTATATEVAAHIRKFIEAGGIYDLSDE